MSYPAKPVLIGKPVRCKGCRNAFVLQPDGIALKREDQPAAAVPAPVAPAPAPAPRLAEPPPKPAAPADDEIIEFGEMTKPAAAAVPVTPPPAAEPDAKAGSSRTPRPGSERLSKGARKGKTEQLEAARLKLSADLAAVAARAANTETAKREERKSERLAKVGTSATAKSAGDDKRRNRKAVLTGEGERAHRERLAWVVGALVVVGLILLLMVVLNFRSGIRAALAAYTAEVADTRFVAYGNAIRARAWLAATPSQPGGTAIALDLDDAEFASERVIELAPAKEAFAQLKGLRPLGGTGWWVAPADAAKAHAALAAIPGESPGKALARVRIRAVEQKAWLAKLSIPEDDRDVLLDLIAGTPSKEGIDFAKRMLDDGEVPEKLHLRPFSGRRGDIRLDLGPPPYKQFLGPYQGVMMRVEGVGWPVAWRVLELVALHGERTKG